MKTTATLQTFTNLPSDDIIEQLQPKNTATNQFFYRSVTGMMFHAGEITPSQNLTSHRLVQPYTSLVVVLSGKVDFSIGNTHYQLSADSCPVCCLVNVAEENIFCRYLFANQSTQKITISNIRAWLSHLDKPHQDFFNKTNVYQWQGDDELMAIYHNLCQQHNTQSTQLFHKDALIFALLDRLWGKFSQNYLNNLNANNLVLEKNDDKKQQNFTKITLEQLNTAWDLGHHKVSDLAKHFAISERWLQRYFKTHFQMTGKQWLTQKNMQRASQWLLIDNLPIKEVAYRCGYSQVANFNQAFKAYYQTTPAKYIHKHKDWL